MKKLCALHDLLLYFVLKTFNLKSLFMAIPFWGRSNIYSVPKMCEVWGLGIR